LLMHVGSMESSRPKLWAAADLSPIQGSFISPLT
jgi:hypothetical protein